MKMLLEREIVIYRTSEKVAAEKRCNQTKTETARRLAMKTGAVSEFGVFAVRT